MKRRNYRRFILLWAGQLISSIGGGLSSFGLGVYIFEQTGSAASMALVTLVAFFPTLILGVPAGILADRYDRRLLMMVGDGCSALGIAYILICISVGDVGLYQICTGVAIASVFSSLIEPSYRATVSDILNEKEFSRASGLVNLSGSARYLISPVLAGFLLSVFDIRIILAIDIVTFFFTVICTGVVRNGLMNKTIRTRSTLRESFKEGWDAVTEKRGILIMVVMSSVITCVMGFMQVLAEPMILSFTDSKTLGVSETICACGMLASGMYLGVVGIKKNFLKVLSVSLMIAGVSMLIFGYRENMVLVCIGGFIFFAMLPFANNCLDYIMRVNIATEVQGRAWGLIGFISQLGYVVAYCIAGVLADTIGDTLKIGVGRGSARVVQLSGITLIVTAGILYRIRAVREVAADVCKREELFIDD